MSLRRYWIKHPLQLRLAGAATLLFSPLLIVAWMCMLAWEERSDLADMYKDAWRYMVKGREAK